MDKQYKHKKYESEIYKMWENSDAFSPEGVEKLRKNSPIWSTKHKNHGKSYSVLMPPPNANAPLHSGHATYTIQDLIIRFKRMQGYDVLYVPGTDHAGFETQVVYERKLAKEGKSRFDFDRDTLYKKVFDFVQENSGIAIKQLKRLGMSSDWNRCVFMLDEKVIDTVYDTFIHMHKDGMIYRDGYMVNYSTFHGTTFSDLETEYIDAKSPLYYIRYRLSKNSKKHNEDPEFLVVATVRPETIYADVAVAVNPKDERYRNLVGKTVINPLNEKELPIIADEYVDMEFGTGALKITPGHDFNDYKIGQKHGLEVVTLINLDGKMNKFAGECEGLFPKQARKKSAEILDQKGAIEKIDKQYENRILVDYKGQNPIEPLVLPNWFIDIEKISELAIKAVESEEVKFYLPRWKKEVLRWMKEKRPWPISRQTIFGIRIPAWYNVEENPRLRITFISKDGDLFSGEIGLLLKDFSLDEIKTGLQRIFAPSDAKYVVSKKSPGRSYLQETDTFDTWFSSGQWPLTTLGYPNNRDFKKYFPTDFMDTMWDIIFFWIARMIMISLYLTKKVPFRNVYIHGAVVDKQGKKMSKSKGNVIDPMKFVEMYGSDALRMGIVVGGNTSSKVFILNEDKVRGYRNFANKVWNIGRFFEKFFESKGYKDYTEIPSYSGDIEGLKKEDEEIIHDLNRLIKSVTTDIEGYRFKSAGDDLYHFIWERLANDYLENIKNREDIVSLIVFRHLYITILKLLHPFMPFVTEAIWRELSKSHGDLLIISKWPEPI